MAIPPHHTGAAARLGIMKAWQYTSPITDMEKSLTLNTDVLKPSPATLSKTEIIVEVLAMSPNPADYKLPESTGYATRAVLSMPATPGMDFCGKVVATHSANDSLQSGQLVFGKVELVQHGTLGQFITVDASHAVPVPAGVDADQAAAAGTTAISAYQCIVPYLGKSALGKRVFINGGSGGTGTWGIQIAKTIGAQVVVSCSTANIDYCKELGADEVLDYKQVDLVSALKEKGQIFDLIVDNVGGTPADLYDECEHYLKPNATYVQIGGSASLGSAKQIMGRMFVPTFLGGGKRPYSFFLMKPKGEDYAQIGQWLAEKKIKAAISYVYPFEEAPQAYEQLKTGRTRGNLVVRVSEA